MQGKIVKGISGFYYVHVVGTGIYECKAKGAFRNQKIKPLVGDNVEIVVVDEENKKGNVEAILPRKNELIRPAVSNIDMALVIFAAAKPDECKNLADFDSSDENLLKYLKGEEIDVDEKLKGYTAVSVHSVVAGFGKASGGRLKNKYPKGLRIVKE